MIRDGSDLCCGAGLHRTELLVTLGIPELVESHVEDHQQLEASSDQANGDIVHRHHLWGLVLDHIVEELVKSFRHTETTEIF